MDTVGTGSKEPRTVPYLRIRNPYRIRTVSTLRRVLRLIHIGLLREG
jgi:hypothetical protein